MLSARNIGHNLPSADLFPVECPLFISSVLQTNKTSPLVLEAIAPLITVFERASTNWLRPTGKQTDSLESLARSGPSLRPFLPSFFRSTVFASLDVYLNLDEYECDVGRGRLDESVGDPRRE